MSSSPLRSVLIIAGNNLRRLIRQPVMLFTTLVLPFMVIAVVGIALGGSQNRLNTGVVSHASDSTAAALLASMKSSTALHVTTFGSDAALDRAVRLGQVEAGIVIPDGYGPTLESGGDPVVQFVTAPNQTGAASIRTVFSALLSRQTGAIQAGEFSHLHTGRPVTAEQQRAQALAARISVPAVQSEAVRTTNAQALGFDYTAPANLVLFIVITSLTSAAALIDTRVRGITARMFAMPLGRPVILMGELLGRFMVAIAQAVVILLISSLAFRVNWGNPLGVALVTVALCAFGGALGMAVGFGARTMAQAVSFGPPLGVALGMLGGCMWPLSIVSSPLRELGHVTPHAWAMDGYLKLINDQASVTSVLPQAGAIAGFAVLMLLLAGVLAGRRRTV